MSLIDAYRGFVFDLDGTVYLGDQLLPGAVEVITQVREVGRRVLYLTNKPLDPTSEYAAKLTRLGLPTAPSEVVSSLDALLDYLGRRHSEARVLAVSEPLVADSLASAGFELILPARAEQADVVVVSFDRTFDYEKLHAAYRAVGAGARIVATNPDRYCPTPEGGLPDCAAMLAAIEACTGARAEAVVGKPSEHMGHTLLERLGLPPGRVLLVGDRVETDVAMALATGMDAALVLSGATSREAAEVSEPAPTYVLDGLGELLTSDPAGPRVTVR